MLGRLRAICLHSITVAWGYLLAIAGGAMTAIDNIGDALGDPNLRDQINNAIGDARVAGRILLGISIITILARLSRCERQTDMWMAILSFLGGPVIKGLIDAYNAKLKASNVDAKIAADLAATEIAAQVSETNAILQYRTAEIGHWYEPDKLMGYFVALYFGKLLIFDKVFGLGTTDPLAGFAATTSNLVVSFYFAKRGFENVARIIKR
jgi:hypothetical protein